MNLGAQDALVERIFQITKQEQQFIQRQLKQSHLNLMQAQALNFIADHPGTMQKAVSQYLGKPEATITNILKVLERRQLIIRQVAQANERRKQLYLTPTGQDLVQIIRGIFTDLEQRISVPLTAEERQTLLGLLMRINAEAVFDLEKP